MAATKKKSKPQNKAKATGAPQIIAAKGGLTSAALLERTLATMDRDNWITKKQGRDFIESLRAVVTDALGNGDPVNLFGLVKIVPRLHTSGSRQVYKEFGNPDSGTTTKRYKAKVSLQATQGIFFKPVKEALPTAQKLSKKMGR
jgi:hypothetical protein